MPTPASRSAAVSGRTSSAWRASQLKSPFDRYALARLTNTSCDYLVTPLSPSSSTRLDSSESCEAVTGASDLTPERRFDHTRVHFGGTQPKTHCPLVQSRWLLEDAYFLLEIRRASHSLNRSHRVCIGTLGMTSTVHHAVTHTEEVSNQMTFVPPDDSTGMRVNCSSPLWESAAVSDRGSSHGTGVHERLELRGSSLEWTRSDPQSSSARQ